MTTQMQTRELNPELVDALKRLRLGRIALSLPERLVLADKQDMAFDDLLLGGRASRSARGRGHLSHGASRASQTTFFDRRRPGSRARLSRHEPPARTHLAGLPAEGGGARVQVGAIDSSTWTRGLGQAR